MILILVILVLISYIVLDNRRDSNREKILLDKIDSINSDISKNREKEVKIIRDIKKWDAVSDSIEKSSANTKDSISDLSVEKSISWLNSKLDKYENY